MIAPAGLHSCCLFNTRGRKKKLLYMLSVSFTLNIFHWESFSVRSSSKSPFFFFFFLLAQIQRTVCSQSACQRAAMWPKQVHFCLEAPPFLSRERPCLSRVSLKLLPPFPFHSAPSCERSASQGPVCWRHVSGLLNAGAGKTQRPPLGIIGTGGGIECPTAVCVVSCF